MPTETTREQLAQLMVGRDVDLIVDKGPATPGEVVLSLTDVFIKDDRFGMAVKGVSLDVRAGEIVAIAGVQGNGQTELVEAIVGLRTIDSGQMTHLRRDRSTTRRRATSRTSGSPTSRRTGCATGSSPG